MLKLYHTTKSCSELTVGLQRFKKHSYWPRGRGIEGLEVKFPSSFTLWLFCIPSHLPWSKAGPSKGNTREALSNILSNMRNMLKILSHDQILGKCQNKAMTNSASSEANAHKIVYWFNSKLKMPRFIFETDSPFKFVKINWLHHVQWATVTCYTILSHMQKRLHVIFLIQELLLIKQLLLYKYCSVDLKTIYHYILQLLLLLLLKNLIFP